MPKTFEVETKSTITQQQLNDLLVTAVEGGVGYWSYVRNYRWEGLDDENEDFSVEVCEFDDETGDETGDYVAVKASDFIKVIGRLQEFPVYKNMSLESILGDADAVTGDIAMQLLLFGDVIYG